MANEEHFAILRQGVETWNKWRKENPNLRPDLSGVVLIGNNLIGADFSETILDKSDLSSANLKGANFQKAILIGSKLTLAILEKADLREAILIKANLVSANLAQANLHRADLRWSCFTEDETIIYSRVVRGADDTTLQGATLTCANLSWGKFKGVCLINADLSDAILRETNLRDSRMTGAKLCGAILDGTNLIGANLEGADLGKAQLIGTDLSYAQLRDTDFSEATIRSIILTSVDLRDTRGLELVEHLGPSAVGIDTIYLSKGQIPVKFMRGCGIADNFIEYMGSLTGKDIENYKCFISYSTKDHEFTNLLYTDLQSNGVRCYFAEKDVKGGRKLHEQIPEAISISDKVLLVLSENSMNSEWVKTEIHYAKQDEIQNNRGKLYPISLVSFETISKWVAFDADFGKDMAREVREYYIPDFSNWRDQDEYKKAFDQLVLDLKASKSWLKKRPKVSGPLGFI